MRAVEARRRAAGGPVPHRCSRMGGLPPGDDERQGHEPDGEDSTAPRPATVQSKSMPGDTLETSRPAPRASTAKPAPRVHRPWRTPPSTREHRVSWRTRAPRSRAPTPMALAEALLSRLRSRDSDRSPDRRGRGAASAVQEPEAARAPAPPGRVAFSAWKTSIEVCRKTAAPPAGPDCTAACTAGEVGVTVLEHEALPGRTSRSPWPRPRTPEVSRHEGGSVGVVLQGTSSTKAPTPDDLHVAGAHGAGWRRSSPCRLRALDVLRPRRCRGRTPGPTW